ncbi:hypothetical protein OS493_004826 [Desmophyllum pertusum]|uniref:Uncharacterized protein n=1 Tax=Desmophyllum pertusum TaxID=174260 RepID=A0A9X0CV37_9CNID|nr:hypothetical protein OS493_004826 [Desmophyllum pertusum]
MTLTLMERKKFYKRSASALERNIYVLQECPHLLHSCLRNASKTVERNVVIPDGVSASWMEWNWLPAYPKTEISHDMRCFALSPDKKLLAGGKGRHIFLFDACSLEKVLGPIEVTETGDDIKHLEFSPEGKLVFFGKLDKWFSVEQGCVKEFPQFAENCRWYEWGSFISGGRYIVVKVADHRPFPTVGGHPFTTSKHSLTCLTSIFVMWATQELHQMQNNENVSCDILDHMLLCAANLSARPEMDEFQVKALLELYILRVWNSKQKLEWGSILERRISFQLASFMDDCGDGGGGGGKTKNLCRECSEFERSNREITLAIVRQRVIDLYLEIFEYQLWDVQSGRPVLEEAFSSRSSVELSPFSYLCHLTTALTNRELTTCSDIDMNALDRHITNTYARLPRYLYPELWSWLRPAIKDSRISLDRKWIAIRHHNEYVLLYEKRNHFDYVNPVHVIKLMKHFAFTDDSMFLVYSTFDKSLHALHLHTGTILSSVSGFSPLLFAPKKQLGYFFHVHDGERIRSVKDLPRSLFRLISFQSGKTSLEATFISAGTIFSLFRDAEYRDTTADVKSCVFSQNGNLIATHLGTKILLFDCGKLLYSFCEDRHECDISYLVFSPDSTLLLYCIQNSIAFPHFKVWDVQNRVFLTSFVSPSRLLSIGCCCFSSDNTKLVICGECSIEIWEYATRPCRLMKSVETDVIYTEDESFTYCTVSPENDLLACCIVDRILLYPLNTSTDQSILELPRGHLGKVDFCQFLKGNRYLISYGVDGTVFLWDLSEWKSIAYAKIAQGRERIITMAVTPELDTAVCLDFLLGV